jgi:hypothetical protein
MNVKNLIRALEAYPPDAFVFQSSDEEGNTFYGVREVAQIPEDENVVIIWPGDAVGEWA